MTFAEECKQLRATLGLTQAEFAARVGVQQVSVARWECGTRTPHRVGAVMDRIEAIRREAKRKANQP